MQRLLARAGLSHLLSTFMDEELTPELLISMSEGGGWDHAMGELGVDKSDSATLRRALTSSESSTATGAPAIVSSSSQPGSQPGSSQPPGSSAFAMSADLAAALATVAATRAPSAERADAGCSAFTSEGFNVTHINHVNPESKPVSAALAAYQRRQMQQNVQQHR